MANVKKRSTLKQTFKTKIKLRSKRKYRTKRKYKKSNRRSYRKRIQRGGIKKVAKKMGKKMGRKVAKKVAKKVAPVKKQVQHITFTPETTIEQLSNINNGKWLILFHADWCGHCHNFMPVWTNLQNTKKVNTFEIENQHLTSLKNMPCALQNETISGFPTISLYNNGIKVNKPLKSRSLEDLLEFIQ